MTQEILLHWQGKSYRVGDDPAFAPQPLPDWWPLNLPPGWAELDTTPWTRQLVPDYARAYAKHGRLFVLVRCAQYADLKRWVHLSVSRKNRENPSWDAMSEVKNVFLGPDRVALQVMPRRHEHVSIHPGCLHLWCCLDGDVTPDFTAGGETI